MAQVELTYRAVQAVSPGKLELTRETVGRPAGYVRIRVEACGFATDATTVEGAFRLHGRGCPDMRRWGNRHAGAGVEG
jgi:propanol-preferring alcohol dehydrogenase